MNGVTIGKELAELRAGYPGCNAVVFADLSTGMVLASDTQEKTTQERLDALCEAAHACLMGRDSVNFCAPFFSQTRSAPCICWQSDASGVRCFVKLPEPAGEALCLVASPDENLEHLSKDAVSLLSRIAAEE